MQLLRSLNNQILETAIRTAAREKRIARARDTQVSKS